MNRNVEVGSVLMILVVSIIVAAETGSIPRAIVAFTTLMLFGMWAKEICDKLRSK